MDNTGQNNFSSTASSEDFADRIEAIGEDVVSHGFIPSGEHQFVFEPDTKEVIGLQLLGEYEGKKAAIRIASRQETTDIAGGMLAFERQNKSELYRGMQVYKQIPWNGKLGYEAMITEVMAATPLASGLASEPQLRIYFNLYEDYHTQPLSEPWIQRPSLIAREVVEARLHELGEYSDHTRKHEYSRPVDKALIERAKELLKKEYEGVDLSFQYADFSPYRISWSEEEGIAILSSPSSWKWDLPFLEIVRAYREHLFALAKTQEVTPNIIDDQVDQWVNEMLTQLTSPEERRLWKLAWIVEAVAGLQSDMVTHDPHANNHLVDYLTMRTRRELITLLQQFPEA